MPKKTNHTKKLLGLLIFSLGINFLSNFIYKRIDLTQDQRYTLSQAAINTLESATKPVVVEILLEGSFPAEFKKLQLETRQLLEEFASKNPLLKYDFINPNKVESDAQALKAKLAKMGILPAQVSVQEGGKITQELVYPWAIIRYEGKAVKVALLKNQLGATSQERITNSIQNLEYAFADGFNKLITPKSKKIAVLSGNGQLEDKYIADFITTLKEYYYTAKFTLDSLESAPQKTIKELQEYDLLILAKPTLAFDDLEKYALDQYTLQGGKSLWLVNQVQVETDSLLKTGTTFAFGRNLNLTDFFFRYGVRINPVLVNDLYAAPLVLATGQEAESQYEQLPWFYTPLSSSTQNHPIVNNIEAVKFEYASAIELLENNIKKTVLLTSSPITRLVGMPTQINLDQEIRWNLDVFNQGPKEGQFTAGEVPLAVLLEGNFTSVFKNRVKPLDYEKHRDEGKPSKMVVISDGHVIKNQLQDNRPLALGYDKWTNTRYGNKDFLLNTVNYLLDEKGLINIRSKKIAIPFLDTQKSIQERGKWQLINILLPLVLLLLFGSLFRWIRKKKYT